MTRSRRKTPIIGITTAESEKDFKQIEHRRERRKVHSAVKSGEEAPDHRHFGNPWSGPKDGRQFLHEPNERLMRK